MPVCVRTLSVRVDKDIYKGRQGRQSLTGRHYRCFLVFGNPVSTVATPQSSFLRLGLLSMGILHILAFWSGVRAPYGRLHGRRRPSVDRRTQ